MNIHGESDPFTRAMREFDEASKVTGTSHEWAWRMGRASAFSSMMRGDTDDGDAAAHLRTMRTRDGATCGAVPLDAEGDALPLGTCSRLGGHDGMHCTDPNDPRGFVEFGDASAVTR